MEHYRGRAGDSPFICMSGFEDLPKLMKEIGLSGLSLDKRKLCIISDSNVAPIYLTQLKKLIGDPPAFVFRAGEANKNLDTLQDIYTFFLDNGLDRKSVVVALGGGVVGDMAGFAAATYMRGIPFIQLPTSLLAQVDASAGGKTAVDFLGYKNIIGAFHQPSLVYINLATLETLPAKEFTSGMAEVIKHGLIGDADYYSFLHKNIQAIRDMKPEALHEVVAGSVRIKSAVVAKDERESGPREVLNFGHCVGHAIESLSEYSLTHGHCVAIGMAYALRLSGIVNNVPESNINQALELIKAFDLPISIKDYTAKDIIDTMYKDKKTINDSLRIVLLKKIGEAYTDENLSPETILGVLKDE